MAATTSDTMNPPIPRRKWTSAETRTLLVFLTTRIDEFNHVRKKKHVFDNLLEDMTSSGISNDPYAVDDLKNKIKSVKTAYKQTIDNNNRSGAPPSIAPFMDLLDHIYGNENAPPEHSSVITSNAGIVRVDTGDFEDIIEICPETPPEISSSEVEPGPSAPKRPKISAKNKIAQQKLDFAEKKSKIIEENKMKRFTQKEAAKERRHKELIDLLSKERGS